MAHLFISARSVGIEITNPKRARTSDPAGPYSVGSAEEVGKIARERRCMTREACGTLLKYELPSNTITNSRGVVCSTR